MGVFDTISESFGNLKKKITGVAANPTPSPLSSSNSMSIQGGGRRRRMHSMSKCGGSKRSGSKRRSYKKRKGTKKVRFSKKNKVYTYKRK